jgi:hypothetical protein
VTGTGTLEYTLTVTSTAELAQLSVVVGGSARVVAHEGAAVATTDGRARYRWDGEAETVRVVVRTAARADADPDSDRSRLATDRWLLGRVPFVEVHWRDRGDDSIQRTRPFAESSDVLAGSPAGRFGDRYALVGDLTERSRTVAGQQINLVMPSGTEGRVATDEVLRSIESAARQLRVGDRDGEVLMFALPEPSRRGGESFPARDEAWINAESAVDDPNSVWIHEYVHTRQDFALASEMSWFREASAEYYAAKLAVAQGRSTEAELYDHLQGSPTAAALTRPAAWDSRRVPYEKGARVLAILDDHIRTVTDGERSLQDVFRRLNRYDGRVTYDVFATAVATVAGQSMDAWLERYVAGANPVASFYEHPDADENVLSPVADAMRAGGPPAVFLVVAVGFSLFASVPTYAVLARTARRATASRHPREGTNPPRTHS